MVSARLITSECTIAVSWSPDGKYIASASDLGLIVDGIDSIASIGFTLSSVKPEKVVWSPMGNLIAVVTQDNEVFLCDLTSRKLEFLYKHNSVKGVIWTPNGKYIVSCASGSDKSVRIYDVVGKYEAMSYKHEICEPALLALSPDAKRLAYGTLYDGCVWIYNLAEQTDNLIHRHTSMVQSLAWSPNGEWLASCSLDELLLDGEKASWQKSTFITPTTPYKWGRCLAWSPDGKLLALCTAPLIDLPEVIFQSMRSFLYPNRHELPGNLMPQCIGWSPTSKTLAIGGLNGLCLLQLA